MICAHLLAKHLHSRQDHWTSWLNAFLGFDTVSRLYLFAVTTYNLLDVDPFAIRGLPS